jgi:MoxR-like ATPase
MPPYPVPTSIDETLSLLSGSGYIADRSLATVLFLSLKMGRPLFLEGEAGVGKTEIAKVLAATLGRNLIRLQCYEGLDVSSAVYEWNYAAQMVEIRLAEAAGNVDRTSLSRDIFTDRFLIKRPILQALESDAAGPPVLLIDELDRADEAFEAFLLEVLADNQVTVPELGTIRAAAPPIVVVTTNRTREIHDALKRRCFYHWVDYPDAERELEIVATRVPGIRSRLAAEVVGFVQKLRLEDLFKRPGVAETLDWAGALTELDQIALDPSALTDTSVCCSNTRMTLPASRGAAPACCSTKFGRSWPPRDELGGRGGRGRAARRQHCLLRARAAKGGTACRPSVGDRRDPRSRGGGRRLPRGFLLDAALRLRRQTRTSRGVSRSLCAFLARARLREKNAAPDVAGGAPAHAGEGQAQGRLGACARGFRVGAQAEMRQQDAEANGRFSVSAVEKLGRKDFAR